MRVMIEEAGDVLGRRPPKAEPQPPPVVVGQLKRGILPHPAIRHRAILPHCPGRPCVLSPVTASMAITQVRPAHNHCSVHPPVRKGTCRNICPVSVISW